MLSYLFSLLYGIAVIFLLWQAFRVISQGFFVDRESSMFHSNENRMNEDRTGQITIHPEILDQDGRITDEELLTVRFSEDIDPHHSAETSAE